MSTLTDAIESQRAARHDEYLATLRQITEQVELPEGLCVRRKPEHTLRKLAEDVVNKNAADLVQFSVPPLGLTPDVVYEDAADLLLHKWCMSNSTDQLAEVAQAELDAAADQHARAKKRHADTLARIDKYLAVAHDRELHANRRLNDVHEMQRKAIVLRDRRPELFKDEPDA